MAQPVVPAPPPAVPASDEPWPIDDLVGPYGLVTEPRRMDSRGWLPPMISNYIASCGDLARARGQRSLEPDGGSARVLGGDGLSRRVAVCEAAERYGMRHTRPVTPILATGRELGGDALPLGEVARCSPDEMRRPDCPVTALPDPDVRIRWVEALELTSRRPRLVPMVMTHAGYADPSERFWMSISTGGAIHRTSVLALLGGIYEIVERDALSIAWLRRLSLPKITPAKVPADVEEVVAWYREREITVHFFDATTDIPVPAVYCVIESPHETRTSQVMGASAGFDLQRAMRCALMEAAGLRVALMDRRTVPTRYRDFAHPSDGAAYMGRAARRKHWGFLLDRLQERPCSPVTGRSFGSPEEELGHLLAVFRVRGMGVYAVDTTPREVEAIGYTVVHVVIPALQPMSLKPLAQFRGHARLTHDHPAATGVQRIRDLSPWPNPMP